MAITGTGHNGITTYSLEDDVLTLWGPGGKARVRAGDPTNNYGDIISFDPLRGVALIDNSSPLWGDMTIEVPLGEVNVTIDAMVMDDRLTEEEQDEERDNQ